MAFEQQYPEPLKCQSAAIQSEMLWPNSSCHPFGVICTEGDCQIFLLLHHQAMCPTGKLFPTCLFFFDLMQDQDPFFIPGYFPSLSPGPNPWFHHTWLELTSLEISFILSSPCRFLRGGWVRIFLHVCGLFPTQALRRFEHAAALGCCLQLPIPAGLRG